MIKKGTAVDLLNLFLFSSVYFILRCLATSAVEECFGDLLF